MNFKIRIRSGFFSGCWYAEKDPTRQISGLTHHRAEAKIFTTFPRALYNKKHDRLVHVWDNSEGD